MIRQRERSVGLKNSSFIGGAETEGTREREENGKWGGVGWLLYLCVFLIARKWIANSVRCHPSFLVTDCWAAFPDMTCQVPTSLDYFTSNSWFPFRPQCLCTAYSGLEQGLRPMLSLLKHVPRLYFTSWNSPSPSVLATCTTATARVLLHTYLRTSVSSLRAVVKGDTTQYSS